jgi:hypothetical protein
MPTEDQKSDTATRELNSQALALAEQLGRIAGTLEGTAEAWLNRAAVTDQLMKVRDGATQLLNSLAGGAANARRAAQKSAANRGTRRQAGAAVADPAHAPGKRHRKPGQTVRGAKHSVSTIPKAKASAAARRRRKSYA